MCKAIEDIRNEGKAEGEEKLADLFNAMKADGAIADFAKAATDLVFRAKMYEKYGIN